MANRNGRGIAAVVIWCSAVAGGCVIPTRIVPTSAVSEENRLHSRSTGFDWSAYDLCLDHVVVGGRVDYCCAINDPALEQALVQFAAQGPESTPALFALPEDRLAYWINAYNATVVRSLAELVRPLIQRGELNRLVDYRPPAAFERMFVFTIDARDWRPADLRRAALRAAGPDWRVRFALCGGRQGEPPLFSEAFLGDALDHQLNAAVSMALEQPQIIHIDHGVQYLRISKHLARVAGRLVRQWRLDHATPSGGLLNVLLQWATPQRRAALNAAVGYARRPLPFDERINQAPFQRPG